MMLNHDPSNENHGSGIIREAMQINACSRNDATHFVLSHQKKIKFIINLQDGIPPLRQCIAPYNKKLAILMQILPLTPYRILQAARLGYFANIRLHPDVECHLPANTHYNVLVGSYDDSQKIVLQCYQDGKNPTMFIKVGNQGSASQMEQEIRFLRKGNSYHSFSLPKLSGSTLIKEQGIFNIQITEDFKGQTVQPQLTPDIYRIATEIAGPVVDIDGEPYTFSHGDFAPWNIRKGNPSFIVFDWEHCGMRPQHYDVLYFTIISQIALTHCDFECAYQKALAEARRFDPDIIANHDAIRHYFSQTIKTLKF